MVQPWTCEFSTKEIHPSNIIAWIRLLGLQYRYYIESLVRALAKVIGKVVTVDYNTTDGKRGKFARIDVVADISKHLIPFLGIDEKKQAVVLEGLPSICYDCIRVGHIKEHYKLCNNEKKIDTSVTSMQERTKTTSVKTMGNKDSRSSDQDLYGPWMQVTNQWSKNLMEARRSDGKPINQYKETPTNQ